MNCVLLSASVDGKNIHGVSGIKFADSQQSKVVYSYANR